MLRKLEFADAFIDNADPMQPRVTIAIEGGLRLSDGERAIRDELVAPFFDELVLAVRNFYRGLGMLGPKPKPIASTNPDAEKPMH